jgi:hypothetical protein
VGVVGKNGVRKRGKPKKRKGAEKRQQSCMEREYEN